MLPDVPWFSPRRSRSRQAATIERRISCICINGPFLTCRPGLARQSCQLKEGNMSALTLEAAHKIIEVGLAYSREAKFNPMGIVVLDARGALKAASLEDNTSLIRWRIAFAKAYGALGMGSGTRKLAAMAAERPAFIGAATHLAEMGL